MTDSQPVSPSEIITEKVELKVTDCTPMAAYIARPSGADRHPGLIVFQEAFGVNSHIRNVTERFAAEGYVAIAPELFHRTAPAGFEGDYRDFPSMRLHMQAVTNEAAEADARAAYGCLHSSPLVHPDRISAVGFCIGGKVSFLANSVLPLRSAVSFYGGGIAQSLLDRAPQLHGPSLLIWGGLDKHITAEHRKAVIDALAAFFCDERSAYEPNAARQAWALTLEFLRS